MTVATLVGLLLAAAIGALVTHTILGARLASPPAALIRKNFRGDPVPAVLGEAAVGGGLVALGAMAIFAAAGWDPAPGRAMSSALAIVIVVLAAAGSWDDHRGDERPRGFKGHLGALRSATLTGGLVKLLAGGLAGLAAGWMLSSEVVVTIEVGLLVALTANLLNLFDRAPGRAAKVALLLWVPLLFAAADPWVVGAAGLLGALAMTLPADLNARGMLGDAGVNPIGGVLGLGLATALPQAWRWVFIVLLVGLNLASERWSFSQAIDRTPWLKQLDLLGRPKHTR